MANVSESLNELAKWGLFLEITGYYDDKFNYLLLYPMMAIIFLVSLIGNSTTFLIIWYDKSMHTTTNYYLSNLAVSDILMTFTMLLEIFGSRSDQKSLFFCKLQWFLIVCLWNNSILTIAALAIERCLAIRHPFKIKPTSTWKRVAKIILLLWLVAIAETSLEMQFLSSVKVHQLTTCFAILTPWARVVHGVLGVITFLIPLLTMTFAYSTILYKVITSKMDNTKDTIINQQNSIGKISKLVSEYRIHISTLKVFLNHKDLSLFCEYFNVVLISTKAL